MKNGIKKFFFTNSDTHQTIAKNISWLFIGELGARFFKLFLTLYAARILGVSGWGLFSYILSAVSIACFLSDAGLGSLITREYSKDANYSDYKQMIVWVKLLYLVVSFIIVVGASLLLMKTWPLFLISVLLGMFIIIDSLRDFAAAIARGSEKMEVDAFSKTLVTLVTSIFGIIMLHFYPTVGMLAIAYLVGSVVAFFTISRYLRPLLRNFKLTLNRIIFLEILTGSLAFAVIMFTNLLMDNEDTLMVGYMSGFHSAGLYAATQKIIQFLLILCSIIGTAMLPILSRHSDDPERFQKIYSKIWLFLMSIALPLVVGGMLLSREIMILFFGAGYGEGAAALAISFLAILSLFPNYLLVSAALVLKQHKRFLVVNIAANIFHILLLYIGISYWGIEGAAAATSITVALVCIGMSLRFVKVRYAHFLESFLKIAVALLIMGLSITFLKLIGLSLLIIIPCAIVAYITILYITREKLFLEYIIITRRIINGQSISASK